MSELLEGKTAVITGASSGIGRRTALLFAEHGADVVNGDLRESPREGGVPTHEKISTETDAEATYIRCDATDREDLESLIAASAEFDGVDVMVNNAGIFRAEEFLEQDEDAFDTMMDINVKGVYFGAQAAARRMREQGRGGAIINLSSVAGLQGGGDYVTYCTSKGAVRLMTYSLADALSEHDIRVNAIHPGVVETTMTTEDVPIVNTDAEDDFLEAIPSGRFGVPDDVAKAALFLASNLSDYVNGSSLTLDGGFSNTI